MGIAARISKRTAVIGTVSAVALAGGIAYAAWTINGGGLASASAGTAQNVTFTAGTAADALYPGATVTVLANGSNPNPFPVNFTFTGATVVVTPGSVPGTCPSSAVTFTPAATPVNIPAKSGSTNGTTADSVVGTAKMDADAANACQGATFTFTLAGAGSSAAS